MSRAPVIDTHVHFWNMRHPDPGLRWVWLDREADHPILGDIDAIKMLKYDAEALWAEARFADAIGFVHVQAAIGSDDPVAETTWLTRMRKTSPVPFTIVGHADLGTSDGLGQLERHVESPYFVGVRDFATESLLASGDFNPVFESTLSWMAERSLVFDVDCEWPNMPALADLARRHPHLPVVLEHIGYPRSRGDEYYAGWRAGLDVLATAPNITCKISGVAMTDPKFTEDSLRRWVVGCLDAFGPERCVLGSNWPVDRLYSSYDVIMDLYRKYLAPYSDNDQNLMLSENAARLYRL